MMGQPDYLLRIVSRDAHAFEELYMDVLAALPHVQKLTSQLAMKIVKRTHALPITTNSSIAHESLIDAGGRS
jgi:DNA-binding Lrp family transcriptional regulator